MKIRPLSDKILVERLEAASHTSGGIVLPDTAKEKPVKGKVVSVGKGRRLDNGDIRAMEVKKGDVVLFAGHAGTDLKIDGTEYLILSESEVLGVIDGF